MKNHKSVHLRQLESFEELNAAVSGAQKEVVQLEHGRLTGYMAHLSVGDLPVDFGAFSLGMRSRGILNRNRITIGMLTGRRNRVVQGSRDIHPGDVLVTPAGEVNERRYYGGASYAVISLAPAELASFFGGEARLRDASIWRKAHFRAALQSDTRLLPRLHRILSRLRDQNTVLTSDAAEFWKRSIVEAMTAAIRLDGPVDSDDHLPSSLKIVRKVEDYLDQERTTSIHISQICGRLSVSRRTLHRAFHDALGLGPVTFLQRRRLCSVRSALRSGDSATTTIADVAMQHGFLNLGRFSGYYHALFDEYPSETFGSREARHRPATAPVKVGAFHDGGPSGIRTEDRNLSRRYSD